MANVQERVRGRAAPSRTRHTFEDGGITVELHKIGPTTIQRIAEAIRKEARALPEGAEGRYPDPPMQIVEIAGERREEANPNDPDHKAALEVWGDWANGKLYERLICLAAVDSVIPIDVTDEEIAAEVAIKRRRMDALGVNLLPNIPNIDAYTPDEQDRIIWVNHICIASPNDLKTFISVIMNRSQVTEEAIQDEAATFRPAA